MPRRRRRASRWATPCRAAPPSSADSAPTSDTCRLLARDHAAPESTLALTKASSLGCERVRPLAWCSRPRSSTASLEGALINVELQILGSLLRAIADEMGAVLVRSAFSANIKERRDCSTGLFDERGRMTAQAEHIPVHLGAMPDAVAAVMRRDPGPGEVWAINDPYAGGTHLPDITLVSRTEVGFAVTRAHHADVGGREPGSMPADSRTLKEEGVVIPPTRLDDGVVDELVAQMHNPDERRGDLRAQIAT